MNTFISFLFYFLFLLLIPFSLTEQNFEQNPLIVGGVNATLGKFPYQGLFDTEKGFCGCSLLNSKWAITAAHCTYGLVESDIRLYFGIIDKTDLNSDDAFFVKKIEQHPCYDDEDGDVRFDISLLKIEGEVSMNEFMAPIALPSEGEMPPVNQFCVITGWGNLEYIYSDVEDDEQVDVLQKAQVPILSNDVCREWYTGNGYNYKIFPDQICAGYEEGGIDFCNGDSGGPLACSTGEGNPVLQGLVSFSVGCAAPNQPGVYTTVSSYIDWIEETMSADTHAAPLVRNESIQKLDCSSAAMEVLNMRKDAKFYYMLLMIVAISTCIYA